MQVPNPTIDGENIVFQINGTTYEIPLSRCSTYEEILAWCYQLSEKTWATAEHIRSAITLACQHHQLKTPSV